MQTNKLGWTDLDLTPIGLGTWAIGGGGWQHSWGPQDDKDSIDTIKRAVDLGINWIDTAPVYGLGHCEEVVGKGIKGLRDKLVIATKCGLTWNKKRKISGKLKKESIRSEIEASLKRLDIDTIDLYQIHWPMPDKEIEEAWTVIGGLIKEGKIRYAGVSNFNIEQLKRIEPIHPTASLQPPYSMLERGIERKELHYCSEKNIGVIAYSPMQEGLLTGKFTVDHVQNLPKDDHRRYGKHFQNPELEINLKFVEDLASIAEKNNMTVAQLSLAWVLKNPAITAAIVGARRPSQIEETVTAGDLTLNKEQIDLIQALLDKRRDRVDQI